MKKPMTGGNLPYLKGTSNHKSIDFFYFLSRIVTLKRSAFAPVGEMSL
jgi:hypothetical protein